MTVDTFEALRGGGRGGGIQWGGGERGAQAHVGVI